jgi:hypothetical protein
VFVCALWRYAEAKFVTSLRVPYLVLLVLLVLQGLPANLANQFAGMQMASGMPNQQLMGAGALQAQQQAQMYDPLTMDVGKLNAMFMQRQQPQLAGGFMRPVG